MGRIARILVVAFVSGVLISSSEVNAQAENSSHRSAVDRLMTALRTMAMIEHFALPIQIRTVAVEAWGFDSMTLGVDEILAIERHVDVSGLRNEIAKAHMAALSTEQALAAASFFESEPAKRILAATLADGIPASDPLRQANLPPPSKEDQSAFEQFSRSAVGKYLTTVSPGINERTQQALQAAIDLAIEKYVLQQRLPNTRSIHG